MNRGLVALRLGDLPEALNCFDEAAERFQRLGASEPDLSIHRGAALIAAGLATDALQGADAAISQLDRIHGRPTSGPNCCSPRRPARWLPVSPVQLWTGPPRRASSSTGRVGAGGEHTPSWLR